ncbi:protein kinase [Endozoicomonas sp. Mp262]|uniref:protein kinase domain-containing protein n=1 Tax=Endozoicomonas sp. Mp262 TaxID=2919499 RepID=UPI0021DB11B2
MMLFFLRDFYGFCIAAPLEGCPLCFANQNLASCADSISSDICSCKDFSIIGHSGGQGDFFLGLNGTSFIKCSKKINVGPTENNTTLKDIIMMQGKKIKRGQRDTRCDLIREAAVLYYLDNERVIKPLGFYDNGNAFLSIEACNIDLLEKVNLGGELDGKTVFAQLLEALKYIHQRNILHMDLKLDNIFLKGVDIVLADFGRAVSIGCDECLKFIQKILNGDGLNIILILLLEEEINLPQSQIYGLPV